jgi:hypothetical protein
VLDAEEIRAGGHGSPLRGVILRMQIPSLQVTAGRISDG